MRLAKRIALKTIEITASCLIVAIAMSYIECGLMFAEGKRRDTAGE